MREIPYPPHSQNSKHLLFREIEFDRDLDSWEPLDEQWSEVRVELESTESASERG